MYGFLLLFIATVSINCYIHVDLSNQEKET